MAGCITYTLVTLAGLRRVRPLADVLSRSDPESTGNTPLPSLSVVVTARDEADLIEATVEGLLRQKYPGLEVIVVDDRSTDGTSEILDRVEAHAGDRGTRLTILHNRELPDGWLGKCNACRLGASRARSEWILFTDGDVVPMQGDLLARVVAYAERERYDHITVIPDNRPVSMMQAALMAVFGQVLLNAARAHEMDRDRPRGGAGIGAFNLIRRSAYDRVGGHALLRMELADDFKLGRLLKESGARQRLFIGPGLLHCPWHRGVINVIRGLEKNLFSGFNFSLPYLTGVTLLTIFLTVTPILVGVLTTSLAGGWDHPLLLSAGWLPFILQVLAIAAVASRQAPHVGCNTAMLAVLQPVSMLLLMAAAWNSALRTIARGGVLWRRSFYPLVALRAGLVRAGAGRQFNPTSGLRRNTEATDDPPVTRS